jgi:hypothetical protein
MSNSAVNGFNYRTMTENYNNNTLTVKIIK